MGELAEKNPRLARSNFARTAEKYLRKQEFKEDGEIVEDWEESLLLGRLSGYSSYIRTKVLLETGRYQQAADLVEEIVAVNPTDSRAPALLMQLAWARVNLDQPRRARQALRRLVEQYPESVEAEQAAETLIDLQQPGEPNED